MVFPHYKAKYHVIIDTDGGIDDFRAICLLLANPEVEVLAITTTDGILAPGMTYQNIRCLLRMFGHEGIPVAPGRKFLEEGPEYRSFAGRIKWCEDDSIYPLPRISALELIKTSIDLEEEPVDFIMLGPLTNLADAMTQYPEIKDEVRKIYWYNEGFDIQLHTHHHNFPKNNKELAIKNYEKSVQLNPDNYGGIEALKKLKLNAPAFPIVPTIFPL